MTELLLIDNKRERSAELTELLGTQGIGVQEAESLDLSLIHI